MRLEQFDSQKMTKYFLAKLPSKLIIAPATFQGNTVIIIIIIIITSALHLLALRELLFTLTCIRPSVRGKLPLTIKFKELALH